MSRGWEGQHILYLEALITKEVAVIRGRINLGYLYELAKKPISV
jgi:hypothetical protein